MSFKVFNTDVFRVTGDNYDQGELFSISQDYTSALTKIIKLTFTNLSYTFPTTGLLDLFLGFNC